ncbi:MAG: DUF3333 domain-containing protein, partial [Rhizobiales bacterium]|nr:DUF3333 domain-containing protein [Hyphomicrobiales bacterium]
MAEITPASRIDWSTPGAATRRKRRHLADKRLQFYGLAAISTAIGLLAVLITSLVITGYAAFVQTEVELDFLISAEHVNADEPKRGNYRAIISEAFQTEFPDVQSNRELRALTKIATNNAQFMLRDAVLADPGVIGGTLTLSVPVSDPFDQLNKGTIDANLPEDQRRISDQEIGWFQTLAERGRISKPFNWGLLFNADSRFPELAGLSGAIVGSFYALLVCFLISFPVGIAAAVYLEEFAPKSRASDVLEVNINNLAAVPSIVFGLLGLAVF